MAVGKSITVLMEWPRLPGVQDILKIFITQVCWWPNMSEVPLPMAG